MDHIVDPDLHEFVEHVVECWGERLLEPAYMDVRLGKILPSEKERASVAIELTESLSMELIHQLPCDLIRLYTLAYRQGLDLESVTQALLISPFIKEAGELIEKLLTRTETPTNVVPFQRPSNHV